MAKWENGEYKLSPWTQEDWDDLHEEIERHRANGCKLFDDKFAKCTCEETNEL